METAPSVSPHERTHLFPEIETPAGGFIRSVATLSSLCADSEFDFCMRYELHEASVYSPHHSSGKNTLGDVYVS